MNDLQSWHDFGRELYEVRYSRKTSVRVFQTRIWIETVLKLTKMNSQQFQYWYCRENESSNIVFKWLKGKTCVSLKTVEKIADKLNLPITKEIFCLPLYQLLEHRNISKSSIKKIMLPFETGKDFDYTAWEFPNDDELLMNRKYVPIYIRDDSDTLYRRGDLYAFTTILALVREAEARGDIDSYVRHFSNAYRILPSICKEQPFKRRWKELLDLLTTLQSRHLIMTSLFMPDENIIKKHINDKSYSTIREKWPVDPITNRFTAPEDPVIFAHF